MWRNEATRIMIAATPLAFLCLMTHGCAATCKPAECSGIVRNGNYLIIVGDESAGKAFLYELTSDYAKADPLSQQIPIESAVPIEIGGPLALDLESVEVLRSGEIVALSERLHALVGESSILSEYPDSMAEVGGRGVEGLAISRSGQVAALWEGGYFDPKKLPISSKVSSERAKPVLCIHHLPMAKACPEPSQLVVLDVPSPPDATQAFRAPDLAWTSEDELVVLLSSTDAANRKFSFKWLQRFKTDGSPVGLPLNLCADGYLPEDLRQGNFEGLDWFEEGESLVMINDHGDPTRSATAVVIDVNPWPSTNHSIPCDQKP